MPRGIPKYPGEYKQKIVEEMLAEKLSYDEVGRRYEITGNMTVARWERIYLTEGPEGLYQERRGRNSKGRSEALPEADEEDLLAEAQRLRAENAYLKNLQALALEDERHQRKKRR